MTRANNKRLFVVGVVIGLIFLGGLSPALNMVSATSEYTIMQIQGDSWESPYEGMNVWTTGVVTADYVQESQRGYFIQDPTGDGNPDTSDGIFVYERYHQVDVGDFVRVRGWINEYYNLTEISESETVILSSGNPIPEPIELDPPSDDNDSDVYYEKLEGMLVTIPDMQVIDACNQYDETAGCRIYHNIDRVFEDDEEKGMIIVVDDAGGFDLIARPGNLVYGLTGPLDYTFSDYKVIPPRNSKPKIIPKQSSSGIGIGQGRAEVKGLSIATYNMYNFFSYYDNFETQKAKHAQAIHRYFREPDILVLEEVHNSLVLEELVATAPIKVDYGIVHVDGPDEREIDVAVLYNTEKINLINFAVRQTCTDLDDGYGPGYDPNFPCDPGFNPLFSRPPLVVHFEVLGKKGASTELWVIANHFKSKSVYEPYFADTLPRRIEQAEWVSSLVDEIQEGDPEAKVIVAGDLNDFEYSDPIGVLEAGGLRALIWDVEKENRYTYNYLGYSQVLDHILITPSLEEAYSEVFIVHFNLDFPFPLYRDDTSLGLCSSDHDAIVAGFRI